MTTKSSINVCITTNQPDTKSNHNPNANHTTKQHAIVSIQLNIVTRPACPDKFVRDNVIAPFYYYPLSLSFSLNSRPTFPVPPKAYSAATGAGKWRVCRHKTAFETVHTLDFASPFGAAHLVSNRAPKKLRAGRCEKWFSGHLASQIHRQHLAIRFRLCLVLRRIHKMELRGFSPLSSLAKREGAGVRVGDPLTSLPNSLICLVVFFVNKGENENVILVGQKVTPCGTVPQASCISSILLKKEGDPREIMEGTKGQRMT